MGTSWPRRPSSTIALLSRAVPTPSATGRSPALELEHRLPAEPIAEALDQRCFPGSGHRQPDRTGLFGMAVGVGVAPHGAGGDPPQMPGVVLGADQPIAGHGVRLGKASRARRPHAGAGRRPPPASATSQPDHGAPAARDAAGLPAGCPPAGSRGSRSRCRSSRKRVTAACETVPSRGTRSATPVATAPGTMGRALDGAPR